MALLNKKCKMCGGELENYKDENFATCIYCGWKYTLHNPTVGFANEGKLGTSDNGEKLGEPDTDTNLGEPISDAKLGG